MAAFDGRRGALLRAVSAADGKVLSELKLSAPPVFDGLIAAAGCLFVSTEDDRVVGRWEWTTAPTPAKTRQVAPCSRLEPQPKFLPATITSFFCTLAANSGSRSSSACEAISSGSVTV